MSSRKQSAKTKAKFIKPEYCLNFSASEMITITSDDGFQFYIDRRCANFCKRFKEGRVNSLHHII